MKKSKKFVLIIGVIFLALLIILLIAGYKAKNNYLSICTYVKLNNKKIIKDLENTEDEENIISSEIDDEGKMLYIVKTSNKGFASNSCYVGYIYSEDDKPYNPDFDGYNIYAELTKVNSKTWKYEEDGNYNIIKRIRKNFFYYKSCF